MLILPFLSYCFITPEKVLTEAEKATALALIGEKVPLKEIAARIGRGNATVKRLKSAASSLQSARLLPTNPEKEGKERPQKLQTIF